MRHNSIGTETFDRPQGLVIYGSNGVQLASLTVASDDQASLTLYDPKTGRARAGLRVGVNGSPALALFDECGRDRAELHVAADGTPGLALANESGKSTAGLPAELLPQQRITRK